MINEVFGELPEWKNKLIAEERELDAKIENLRKSMEDPEMKLCYKEWDMLRHQLEAMSHYWFILDERLTYYGLGTHGRACDGTCKAR